MEPIPFNEDIARLCLNQPNDKISNQMMGAMREYHERFCGPVVESLKLCNADLTKKIESLNEEVGKRDISMAKMLRLLEDSGQLTKTCPACEKEGRFESSFISVGHNLKVRADYMVCDPCNATWMNQRQLAEYQSRTIEAQSECIEEAREIMREARNVLETVHELLPMKEEVLDGNTQSALGTEG